MSNMKGNVMERTAQPGEARTTRDEQVSLLLAFVCDMGLAEWHIDEQGEWVFSAICHRTHLEDDQTELSLVEAVAESGRLIWRALSAKLS